MFFKKCIRIMITLRNMEKILIAIIYLAYYLITRFFIEVDDLLF